MSEQGLKTQYSEGLTPSAEFEKARDPWRHRSAGMRCQTCMWFVKKEANVVESTVGRCRRHAPAIDGYPVVFVHDWCGDHKLDENRA
jgi:hypothetical protein